MSEKDVFGFEVPPHLKRLSAERRFRDGDPQAVDACVIACHEDGAPARDTFTTAYAEVGLSPYDIDAAVYNRHAYQGERRLALETWEGHIFGLLDDRAPTGNIISLPNQVT